MIICRNTGFRWRLTEAEENSPAGGSCRAEGGRGEGQEGTGKEGGSAEGCGEEKGAVDEVSFFKKTKKPEAYIRLETRGGITKVETGGDLDKMFVMVPIAVGTVSKCIYDKMVQDGHELEAERAIHEIQEMLKPTSKVWDFGTLEELAHEAEND